MREYATQMEAAKKGIITPEMKIVAEKEYWDAEKIREKVAVGEICIPANVNHKSLSPEGIGGGLRTKIKACAKPPSGKQTLLSITRPSIRAAIEANGS